MSNQIKSWFFVERGKSEYPGKNVSELSRKLTNSVHIWRQVSNRARAILVEGEWSHHVLLSVHRVFFFFFFCPLGEKRFHLNTKLGERKWRHLPRMSMWTTNWNLESPSKFFNCPRHNSSYSSTTGNNPRVRQSKASIMDISTGKLRNLDEWIKKKSKEQSIASQMEFFISKETKTVDTLVTLSRDEALSPLESRLSSRERRPSSRKSVVTFKRCWGFNFAVFSQSRIIGIGILHPLLFEFISGIK